MLGFFYMSIYTRIQQLLGTSPKETPIEIPKAKEKREVLNWNDVSEFEYSYDSTKEIPPDMKSTDYLKAEKGWVYAAVNAIADEIGNIELKLYRKKGEEAAKIRRRTAIYKMDRSCCT